MFPDKIHVILLVFQNSLISRREYVAKKHTVSRKIVNIYY